MKKLPKLLYLFLAIVCTISCKMGDRSQGLWPEIKSETKPWTRWWWMGNGVDQENIGKNLKQYADAGFGGVEITPIYGVRGYENKYLKYLSPAWMKILDETVKDAKKAGMGVDMNLGTGWPFGGPQITWPYAASKLIVQTYQISANKRFREKILMKDPRQKEAKVILQVLIAKSSEGETLDITSKVESDGTLNWKPDAGEWELTAAFCGKTLQRVKRAAPGGEGLSLDHFSAKALGVYLKRFDTAFSGVDYGIRSFFNDSYEVYGSNWTEEMFDEFEKRRGYPLEPWLRELTNQEDSSDLARRIRYDYRQTLSDMLVENFTQNWTTWSHEKKSLTRNQAHGSPGNLIDLYAAADIPECETFGSSFFPIPGLRRDSADIRNVDPDPVMLKFASSAAHVAGKPLTSSETFTWLAEHFKVSLSQCKPEVDQVFLSGVNHVFFHGTTYSPASADWPGWLFYASVHFGPTNSFWPHLKGMNHYIARCQSVLQSGLPDNELLVYWPVSDFWMNSFNPNPQIAIHDIDKWLHPTPFYKNVTEWLSKGYSIDFTSDELLNKLTVNNGNLQTPAGAAYKTLIFPPVEYLPEATFQRALEFAKKGALVVFGNLPGDVPGYGNLTERRNSLSEMISNLNLIESAPGEFSAKTGNGEILVSRDITTLLNKKFILPEPMASLGLKFIRRTTEKGTYYFIVNHTPVKIDTFLTFNKLGKFNYLLNPLNDQIGSAFVKTGHKQNSARIQLASGESMFLFTSDHELKLSPWKYESTDNPSITLEGPWKLVFSAGGPVLLPAREMNELKLWTESGDSSAVHFSGTAVYSTTFNIPGQKASDYLLDLGQLHESALVKINGHEAGIAWSLPFTLRVGEFVKPGLNTIQIEVANLMANRIRWMDQKNIEWRKFREINFVNINYKPFNASKWETLPSGLAGPVTLSAIP
jgi:hypothetical protein